MDGGRAEKRNGGASDGDKGAGERQWMNCVRAENGLMGGQAAKKNGGASGGTAAKRNRVDS